jgi:hypothetical protein
MEFSYLIAKVVKVSVKANGLHKKATATSVEVQWLASLPDYL